MPRSPVRSGVVQGGPHTPCARSRALRFAPIAPAPLGSESSARSCASIRGPWDAPGPSHAVSQPQGISPQFPGVLVGPPHVRKCHQMSSKEHIQLGWVVRWVLSTPPGQPAPRGSAGCMCRASTSLAPLYSSCAGSAFGWGSNPNSRSAPAPVESSPGLVLWPVTVLGFRPAGSFQLEPPNRDRDHCSASRPAESR
jgi:hypothetical protein